MIRMIFLLILLVSCGEHSAPLENHGDIFTDGSYFITKDNHPALYGEKDCFLCHQEYSIHQVDRINGQVINLESIRATVKLNGLQSCSTCHGSNEL